ncbi:MAG: hypothetical protein HY957_08585 [Nitrospirae bacterium]|nr:hypothetical protein [Nitrospirota bacterium]
MRIKVTFRAEKLPILYSHRFMALIKEALEKSDTAPNTKKNCLETDLSAELVEKWYTCKKMA